jgi:hypothetical protein
MRRRAQFRANIFNNCAACQFKLEDYAGAVKISSAALEINPKYCAVKTLRPESTASLPHTRARD